MFPQLTEFVCIDERLQGPQSINLTRTDLSKPNPKTGTVQLDWNKTGSLLLVRFGQANSHSFYTSLTSCCLQRTFQRSFTYTPSRPLQSHSHRNCVVSSYTQNRFSMLDGIQSGKAVWQYVVAPEVYIPGAMSGSRREEERRRWLNASGFLRVSTFVPLSTLENNSHVLQRNSRQEI